MRIHLRVKTEKGGVAYVRCDCCTEKRVFSSWKKAREWAQANGHGSWWKATRI